MESYLLDPKDLLDRQLKDQIKRRNLLSRARNDLEGVGDRLIEAVSVLDQVIELTNHRDFSAGAGVACALVAVRSDLESLRPRLQTACDRVQRRIDSLDETR